MSNDTAPAAVWFLQHPPCYTLGRSSNLSFLHFNISTPPAPLYRINRGGEVTHHCDGQLMIYLVVNLQRYRMDLHFYIRMLEQIIIDTLGYLNLKGHRINNLPGVWIENKKIAAIGIGIKHWVTQHGIALNIRSNLEGFKAITPCGLTTQSVGRLQDWIPTIDLIEIQNLIEQELAKNLCFNFRHPTLDEKFIR